MPPSVRAWVLSKSLAARVSSFVFAATLISALAVAWTSAQALRAFLRSKVEQKIPATVEQVRDRLDLWYAQRLLDVQVFARSAIVVDDLTLVARSGRRASKEQAELERYLSYVLEGLRQYTAIFVLDAEGRTLLGVGRVPALEPGLLRRLARVEDVDVSGVLADASAGRLQVITSSVRARDGRRLLTLHAALPLAALEEQLADAAPASPGRTLVFDAQGHFVAGSRPVGTATHEMSPALAQAARGTVHDYVASDSLRVVGSALAFPRLGWTLVVEEDYDVAFAPIAAILQRTVTLNLVIVLALSALAFAVVASLVRPLHALSDCARRLRDGEEDVQLPVVRGSDEVGILTRSFGEMVTSLKRANEVLEQLAITDGLTKIHNHRFFQDQLGREVKRADRTGAPLALVLVDIDDFKALNDRYGHAAGDGVLEQLAAILVSETRDEDLVARYGGEEFAILAPGTDRAGAVSLAEKLRIAASASFFDVAGHRIAITVSVGVAAFHGDRDAFFHEADRALYAAKGAGKDCVVASDAS
jgi:diguanylate cyclase (GGDEF)-like protein